MENINKILGSLAVAVLLVLGVLAISGCIGENGSEQLGGAYKSANYGFSITPPEGWVTDESEQFGAAVQFLGPRQDDFTVNINVVVEELPYLVSLKEYTEINKEQVSTLTDCSLVSQRDIMINGVDAHEIVYTFSQDTFDLKIKQVYLIKKGDAYVITFAALQSNYDAYESEFEQSVKTFELS